jgi:two-component system C4-dicarboxylate transport response regulator DctD
MMVMIIDDDRESLESMDSALQLNGFRVMSFSSPGQALEAYDPQTVDAVITDYHFAQMTGVDVIGEIQRKKRNTPVIVVSGDPSEITKKLSIKAGALAFFLKPVNIKEIIEVLNQVHISL